MEETTTNPVFRGSLSLENNSHGIYVDPVSPIVNSARQIEIYPLDYGYKVRIGCQEFACEDIGVMMKRIEAYLRNPDRATEEWLREKILP